MNYGTPDYDPEREWEAATPIAPQRQRIGPANPKFIPERLDIVRPTDWQGKPVPEQKFIVDGVFPAPEVTSFNGVGGGGKSRLMMQLLACTSLGVDWLGLPTQRCKSLGIFCEDSLNVLHQRMAEIAVHYGAELGDLDCIDMLARDSLQNALMTFENRYAPGQETPFFYSIMNHAIEFGARLVVLDSRYDFFPGDQIDTPQVHQFVSSLKLLAKEIDGAVVLVSHPSRSGMQTGDGESGSVAWHNKVRSRVYLRDVDHSKDESNAEIILEFKKLNYGRKLDPMPLLWHEGGFAPELQLTGAVANIEERSAEKVFLACLDGVTRQGRHVTDSKNSPRYAPKMFRQMRECERLTVKQLERAMLSLFEAGVIIVDGIKGADRHSQKAIVRAAGSAGSPPVSD